MTATHPHRVASYAGVGSRQTPPDILATMRAAAAALAARGYTLRSGHADGADLAFEEGAGGGPKEIFIPWPRFNGAGTDALALDDMPGRTSAMELAAPHHPGWTTLKDPVRRLMARNVMQVLGRSCDDPVRFVLCWAPAPRLDDAGRVMDARGGTGLAVRLAYAKRIPVFHLGVPEHAARLERFVHAAS